MGDRNPPLWDFFWSESLLCCGIFFTQNPTKTLFCCLDFPHSEVTICKYCWWDFSPIQKQCCKLTKPSQYQIKHSRVKDQHFKETCVIPNRQTIKQARQDLNKYFHSKDIYICLLQKVSPIYEYIPLNTYLITSNKSNTKLYYNFVSTYFLKRNTDDPDLIHPSCRYVQHHSWTPRACPSENIFQ